MSDQATGGWLSPLLQRRRLAAALPYLIGETLDYGCGGGQLFGRLAPSLQEGYVGYDVDSSVVRLARSHWPNANFVDKLDELRGRQFDSIVSLAVIEHVPSVSVFLETLKQMLRPDGRIIMTSPNASFDGVHRLGARMGFFSMDASDEHNEYVSKESMRSYCEELGLRLVLHRPFLFGANQLFIVRLASS